MKKFFIVLSFACFSAACYAQMADTKMPPLDKSPMDMAYMPNNYPVLKIQGKATEPLIARIIYSRPQKAGRTIFGELVEYGKVWRLGANEATEAEFYRDVKIGNKKITKGKYTLYALVNATEWTVIFNKETDIWGAFKYDSTKDVLRIQAPVQKTGMILEDFTIIFEKATNVYNMVFAWDDVRVAVPVSLK
jgi:hypothetical protein